MVGHNRGPDEETPLLQGKSKTPLPWSQMSLIFLSLIAEPISSTYIFPFINQLIGELGVTGGDDRKIGYYAGLIESLFFVTQALTAWKWSRISDFIGRRPVVLFGLLGLSISNFAFGLSRTLTTLIMSRCIAGILNGNVGVMKSMLGDITDHTNMAQASAFIPAIFCVGATIAALYGGILAKPQERWPHTFAGEFWATYPYFLPSLVSGSFTLLAFLLCAIFMKESLPSKTGKKPQLERSMVENPSDDPSTDDAEPIPMFILMKTYSVMMPAANYAILALVDIGIVVLVPLFCSAPLEIGGLGLPPSTIGMFLSIFGVINGIVQGVFTARVIDWLGAKNVFCYSVLLFYVVIIPFPIMSAVVIAQGEVGPIIWILLAFQLIFLVLAEMSFPVVFVFVTRAAPNKQSLGTTNGLSQSLTSVARAIGPATITSLFAIFKEHNLLGGNFVYVVMAMIATILVVLSRRLPDLKDEE